MIRIHLTSDADVDQLRSAVREVYGGPVQAEITSDNPQLIVTALSTREELVTGLRYIKDAVPWPGHDHETLYFDIETHNAEKRWDMPLEAFFRMGQYAWGIDGEVHITTDLEEMSAQIDKAYGIVAHNGHSFDFSVMLGDRAFQKRSFDTMVFGNQALPVPKVFTNRKGVKNYRDMGGQKKVVPHTMKWLSLDNLAFQLKVPGKIADLKELAKKYNPPKTKVENLDFSLIPLDDPDFVAYGEQDVTTLQYVTRALIEHRGIRDYDWREQDCAKVNAQISRNGFRLDVDLARGRVEEQARIKDETLKVLESEYGFPTSGKAPWSSKPGRESIIKILQDNGLDPFTTKDWPMGKTGPSLGGKTLLQFSEGTAAEPVAESIALLAGQRPLAGQALDNLHVDGKVHPDITSLQASGRMSVTKPSLATWTARGPGSVEKEYFIASPGNVILEYDFSNADSRAVAAMSGDPVYHEAYFGKNEDGTDKDGHEITGRKAFGNARYDKDPKYYRQTAKAGSHAWNYGAGWKRLSFTLKITEADAQAFVQSMASTYRGVVDWQNKAREEGERTGFVVNRWGRKMRVEADESYTTSPALLGQSSTRELLFDGLLKLPYDVLKMVVVTVHDAIVLDCPKDQVARVNATMVESFSTTWNGVHFPLSHGEPSRNWMEAGH